LLLIGAGAISTTPPILLGFFVRIQDGAGSLYFLVAYLVTACSATSFACRRLSTGRMKSLGISTITILVGFAVPLIIGIILGSLGFELGAGIALVTMFLAGYGILVVPVAVFVGMLSTPRR
jgi:hypothetical protein